MHQNENRKFHKILFLFLFFKTYKNNLKNVKMFISILANYLEISVTDAKTYGEGRQRFTDYAIR